MAVTSTAEANLLQDPAFEGLAPTGTQAVDTYVGGGTTGWYTAVAGNYLYWDFGPGRGQFMHLNNAVIQQVFSTAAGVTYDVSFQALGEDPSSAKSVDVWIDDGDVVDLTWDGDVMTYNTGGLNFHGWSDVPWTVYSFSFTATGAESTISVRGNNRLGVDDFEITAQEPIPEPATLSLVGIGALAMIMRRKRKQR